MTKQFVTYNSTLVNGSDTPAASQVPILDSNGAMNSIGVISTGAISTTKSFFLSGVASPTTTVTLDGTVSIVRLDASGGAFTATLPPAASATGLLLYCKRINATNLPTLKGNASENIDGANTYTGLSAQFKSVLLFCNGAGWDVLSAF